MKRFVAPSVLACALAACDPTGPSDPRGPSGGVLDFDAAVFGDPGPPVEDSSTPLIDASSGVDHCTGVATSCPLLALSQCTSAQGCTVSGSCSGLSTPCYAFYNSTSCISQSGCSWAYSSNKCQGFSESCSVLPGATSCTFQQGCQWKDGCAGAVTPCSLLSVATCTRTPGCRVERN